MTTRPDAPAAASPTSPAPPTSSEPPSLAAGSRRSSSSGWSALVSSVAAVAVVVLLGLSSAACSSSSGASSADPASPEGTTASPGADRDRADAGYSCESVEPGVVVDRTRATVSFDPESVCPGWVTVEQGTQVTFTNRGPTAATVVITATELPGAAEVARFTLEPGASQPLDTLDVGRMGFATDALPGFRGTVEVVAPGSHSAH